MIDRFRGSAAYALFLLICLSGCAPNGQSVATSVPASSEPLDFAVLNGKTISIEGLASGDFSVEPPETKIRLRVIGKTVIWGDPIESSCILKGRRNGDAMAVLYRLDQPGTNVKVPCEGGRDFGLGDNWATAPADVSYSSTMTLEGNLLELSGELTEHNSVVNEDSNFTVTQDIKHRQHAKVRVSADKCQVLEFTWTIDVVELHSSVGHPVQRKRSVRATGCTILAQRNP